MNLVTKRGYVVLRSQKGVKDAVQLCVDLTSQNNFCFRFLKSTETTVNAARPLAMCGFGFAIGG